MSARAIPNIDLPTHPDLAKFVPEELRRLGDLQSAIPEVAKNQEYLTQYPEPVAELNFTNFISSLIAKALARTKTQ